MEQAISRQTIETETLIGTAEAQQPLRAEAAVSGAGREMVEILMTDANIALSDVKAQTDRVSIEGELRCQAAYRVGDAGSVRGIAARAPVQYSFEIKGTMNGMYAQARAVVEDVSARYENGHMIFAVSSLLSARVTELTPVDLISDIAGTDSIETKYVEICSVKVSAEAGAQALLSESAQLPEAMDARCALMEWGESEVEAVTPDVGGVRISGKVNAEALIAGGAAGKPVTVVKYALPFDQLIEMPDWLAGDVRAQAALRDLTTEVVMAQDGGDAVLRLEAALDLRARAIGRDCVRALADAYATQGEQLHISTKQVNVCREQRELCIVENVKGTLLLPEESSAAGSVCAVRARPLLGGFSLDDGFTNIEGVLDVQVIYMPAAGDAPAYVSGAIPFSVVMASSLPDDAWISLSAVSAEGSALMSDRIEIKCAMRVAADVRDTQIVAYAAAVEETGAQAARYPGVILAWPAPGDTAWDIGKRYTLPVDTVTRGNGGEETPQPGRVVIMRS